MRPLGILVAALVAALPATTAFAQATLPPDFVDQLVVGGLSTPTGLAPLPDGRMLVVEQLTARIRLIVNGALSATDPVTTVPGVRTDNFHRGLLGIAVDPRWPASPYIYVHYAGNNGKLMISRFTAAGDLAFTGNGAITINPATRYDLFTDLFDAAHNGGTLRFGPDQMLYVSIGDSIYSSCAAQNITTLRGVVLRLEIRNLPAGAGGPPARSLLTPPDNPFVAHPNANARLVYARGLRNPFRFQIDRANGTLFVTDVGEDTWEEIDRVAVGGLNFGWPLFEGPDPWMTCPGVSAGGMTAPIFAYLNGRSGICAGIYRRPASLALGFPREYEGDLLFSDYYTGTMRRLRADGATWVEVPPVAGQPADSAWATGLDQVSDYCLAADGSLWCCRQAVDFAANTGAIRRISYTGVLGVEAESPSGIALAAPVPSPAASGVELAFTLPERTRVELSVFDLAGRWVATPAPMAPRDAGWHHVRWDGRSAGRGWAAPGVYLARLSWTGGSAVRRIVVSR